MPLTDINANLLLLLLVHRRKKKQSNKGKFKVHLEPGFYLSFYNYNDYQFKSLFRMTINSFTSLMSQLLSTGRNINDLDLFIYLFRMGHGAGYRMSASFFKVSTYRCQEGFRRSVVAIMACYDTFVSYPNKHDYQRFAEQFASKTNRYNIIGSMDGTYIKICKPDQFDTLYYAIHMLAVYD